MAPSLMVAVMALSSYPQTDMTPPFCEAAHARGSARQARGWGGVVAADAHSDVPTAARVYMHASIVISVAKMSRAGSLVTTL